VSVTNPPKSAGAPQRIAKLLARAGVASRREIERMIEEGRIALNGTVLDTPATILTSLHGVTVDGAPVAEASPARLFRYHKAAGLLTAERDFTGRSTIYDNLPEGLPRVIPVGRLDLNTEGLLLLTTDGELKRELELPATGVERSYRARAYGQVSQEQLEDLMLGIEIEGVQYGPINANIERRTGANLWIEMTLTEGKNREVRRVLEYLGLQVSRLIRTRYGPFYLGDLPAGDVDEIRQTDLITFRTVLSKPGGGKAASNLQFSVRQRVVEPVEKPAKIEPEGRRRIAKQVAAPAPKGPVFTARATPKPKAPEEKSRTSGRLSARDPGDAPSQPGRAARAKSFRDARTPRDGDLVDRPRGRRDARGDARSERPFGARPNRTDERATDRPRDARPPRAGGSDTGERPRKAWAPRPGADGGERPNKPWAPRQGANTGERPNKPWAPRQGADSGERPNKPWAPRQGADSGERPRKPWAPRTGDAGNDRPRTARPPRAGESSERPRTAWAPRSGDANERPRGPRPERSGGNAGERPHTPRPPRGDGGDRPGGPRPQRPGGPNRPQRPGGPSRPPRGRS
jgi:23S rRNA pseudouridine2605 synthase